MASAEAILGTGVVTLFPDGTYTCVGANELAKKTAEGHRLVRIMSGANQTLFLGDEDVDG
jgi:hypothetical protein